MQPTNFNPDISNLMRDSGATMRAAAGLGSASGSCLVGINALVGMVLCIIGCVAAAGHLTGVVAGGCAVGLSVPVTLLYLVQAKMAADPARFLERIMYIVDAILIASMCLVGALGIAGIVSAVTVGWVIVGPLLAIVAIAVIAAIACCGYFASK